MANFSTTTKVIINDISGNADSVAGSLAAEINDYLETIDDAKLVDTKAVMLDRSRIAYIIRRIKQSGPLILLSEKVGMQQLLEKTK